MARMMRDGHLGFAHLREIDPPRTPRISGRYLDRWVGVWENACNVPDAFQRMARDLGEFWLLDQWFTVGIRGYVQSTAGVWLSESPARATVYRADLADVLFDVAHGMLAGDIPGAGSLRDMTPTPPGGWERHLDWTPPVG